MNYNNKTKDELINELHKSQQEYDSLKTSYENDITERKQVEELLKENTERLHEAQKLACIGVWNWKSDTDTVTWTDELYRIAGLDPMLPAPTYKEHSNLYTPESWELLKTSVEKAMETGESYQLELELIRPNGDTRIVNAFGGAKYDSKGQINGLFGTVQDITERKQEEEELALLAHTIRSISESVSVTDQENKILFVNDAFLKTYGYTLEELIGKSISIVRSTTTEPSIDDILHITFQGGWHGELLNQKKDGTEFPIALSTSIVCNEKGQTIALVGIAIDITERKLAEEMMKTSEEKYRMIFNEVPIGIAISTIEGKIIDVNKAQADMIGCTVEELKGRSVNEYYVYSDKRMEMIELFEKTGKVRDFEMELEKKDGSIVVEMMNIDQIKIESKDYLFATGRDITERKKAKEALRLEKENFRHSLDDSPLGVRIATLEGNTIYANKTLLDLYGYDSLEELQKTPLKNRYSPESYIQAQKRKRQRKRGDLSTTDYEISIIRKNGEIRYLQVFRKEILWDGARQFQVIYEDITRRKLAEAALKESETIFRSLFENSQIGISTATSDGRLLRANPAYARMYGYESPEKMLAEVNNVGKLYANLADRQEVLRILTRDGFIEAKEVEVIRRDGSRFFVLVSAREIRDTEGKLLYNQATHIDLTERRTLEKELRTSKELLEKLNQHLYEIRENERAVISREIHDELGQSMTAIKLDLNHLYKYVNTNPEAIRQLGSMIELVSNTIKDVQRISSDLRPGILDDLGLAAAIEWYSEEFEKRTGIRCSLSLDDSILGDSQKDLIFFRVLQEALTNVIRHANASSVGIKLYQSKAGTAMTIQDNGIGMLPEKKESGKSLGLIGMRERVRQFGGKIDISSKKGEGTKLTIIIPEKKINLE
jgi:PAS domain S-box-containing protein